MTEQEEQKAYWLSKEPLKPCPYCGEKADIASYGEDGQFIVCSNIHCQNSNEYTPEAWNSRPREDALRIELDKADGAGLELMQENEKLRAEVQALREHETVIVDEAKRQIFKLEERNEILSNKLAEANAKLDFWEGRNDAI
jgi:ssDNA-binding Zn-finger/Zn-ribbon topoisomerase 1